VARAEVAEVVGVVVCLATIEANQVNLGSIKTSPTTTETTVTPGFHRKYCNGSASLKVGSRI